MSSTERVAPVPVTAVRLARGYLGGQAVAGAIWWVAVFASDDVARWTLGRWEPALLVGPDLLLFVGASAVAAITASRWAALVAAVWTTSMTVVLTVYGLVERVAGAGVVLMAVATLATLAAAATIWFGRLPTGWFFVGPFTFRIAAEASGTRHLIASLVQLVIFWTTFFVVIPLALAAIEDRLGLDWPALGRQGVQVVGIVVFVVASGLGLWSCVTMALIGHGTPLPADTARDLVVAGPYRSVRNPMAVAGVLQVSAVGLWIGSWLVIVIAVAGAAAWNQLIRPVEEADLAARFGDSYRQYVAHVRCWFPTRPWRGA
ncbi:isoprenylcysteine carboxylmethyltransferase family protein [soil metagenome]